MTDHRTAATVSGDGSVTIYGLPFAEGAAVEVIVRPTEARIEAPPGRRFGSEKGVITVPADFDEPLDDLFADYM